MTENRTAKKRVSFPSKSKFVRMHYTQHGIFTLLQTSDLHLWHMPLVLDRLNGRVNHGFRDMSYNFLALTFILLIGTSIGLACQQAHVHLKMSSPGQSGQLTKLVTSQHDPLKSQLTAFEANRMTFAHPSSSQLRDPWVTQFVKIT